MYYTHGMSKTPEYYAWNGMKRRCFNPNHKAYSNYGDRGITVCDRWLNFENFFADMGLKPTPKHSLDRIDNDSDYNKYFNFRYQLLSADSPVLYNDRLK